MTTLHCCKGITRK